MQAIYSFFIATLFVISSIMPTFAQQTLLQKTPRGAGEQDTGAAEEELRGGSILIAVVSAIDYSKGLVTLETEIGRLQLTTSPAELANLREGDTLIVYVAEEEPIQQT